MFITRHLQPSVGQMMLFLQLKRRVTDRIRACLAYLFVEGCYRWYLCLRVDSTEKCAEGGAIFKSSDTETHSQYNDPVVSICTKPVD